MIRRLLHYRKREGMTIAISKDSKWWDEIKGSQLCISDFGIPFHQFGKQDEYKNNVTPLTIGLMFEEETCSSQLLFLEKLHFGLVPGVHKYAAEKLRVGIFSSPFPITMEIDDKLDKGVVRVRLWVHCIPEASFLASLPDKY